MIDFFVKIFLAIPFSGADMFYCAVTFRREVGFLGNGDIFLTYAYVIIEKIKRIC